MSLRPRSLLAAALTALGLAACAQPPAGSASAPAALPPGVDLGQVMEQVHFAWRPEGEGFSARHSTYAAHLVRGALSFRPEHESAGEPVRFGEAVVSTGGTALPAHAGLRVGDHVGDRGELLRDRGVAEETLRNADAGVEQSWRFSQRPGNGDLEVRVPVLQGRYQGSTEGGLHFASGALLVRYGHATWIDAEGEATAVPARFGGGAISLRVPAEVLERSVYPAVLDPVIGPEIGVDTPLVRPATSATNPVLAWGGSSYLVVWSDPVRRRILATRVTAEGKVLDPSGIAVFPTDGAVVDDPSVAWDGANWLVAFDHLAPFGTSDIYGARVGPDGAVLDQKPILISLAPNHQSHPIVRWNGTNHFVLWEDYRGSYHQLYGARVTPGGAVLDPAGLQLTSSGGDHLRPAAVWNGTSLFVVWEQGSGSSVDLYGERVSPAGVVLDASPIPITTAADQQRAPAVAWDGANHLVVWEDSRSMVQLRDIYAARVSGAGALLDTTAIAIAIEEHDQCEPAVWFDGNGFLVSWSDQRSGTWSINSARVGGAGNLPDPFFLPVSGTSGARRSAIASDGAHALVVWSGSATIAGARISAGKLLDQTPLSISTVANAQRSPAVAFDGTNYLAVWVDDRVSEFANDLYGARISPAGASLDPAGILITKNLQASDPALVFGAGSYFLAFSLANSVYGSFIAAVRITPAGAVLGDVNWVTPNPNPGGQYNPAVATDGTNYLVVWSDYRGGTADIYGTLVSATGTPLGGAGFVISEAPLAQRTPAVSWSGSNYLVAWADGRSNNRDDIYAARVTGAGKVLDPSGIALTTAAQGQTQPALAWSGSVWLAAWTDARTSTSTDIWGTRVGADGAVLDPAGIAISSASGLQSSPKAVWDGSNFAVVWSDGRSHVATAYGDPADVYGARVSSAGAVQDPPGFLLALGRTGEYRPALAMGPRQQALLLYTQADLAPGIPRVGITGRIVSFEPAGNNHPPVATALTVTTAEDTPLAITLKGTDPDNDPLSFSVVLQPAHGTLSGSGAALTYTPALDYNGSDSFTFTASDGVAFSAAAAVSITVTAVNDAPVAVAQTVTTPEDTPKAITLAGSDVEGSPLTYSVATPPAHGALTGSGAGLTYTPATNFNGADSFTFTASDGALTSAPATVGITVTPVNDAPVASDQAVSTAAGAALTLTLTASDVDGDVLTFSVISAPLHGTLSGGTGAVRVYTPAAGYTAADSFKFTAFDGKLNSAAATVSITASAPGAPTATAQSVTIAEDTPLAVTLAGSKAGLTFTVLTQPAHGVLSGTGAAQTYTPAADYNGSDSFTFKVTDGSLDSGPASVSITVTAVNDAPVASPQSVSLDAGTTKPITLAGTDVEGSPLTFSVVTQPAHGALTGSGAQRTYAPAAGYAGSDQFTFKVSDGALDSVPATVSITINAIGQTNHAPAVPALLAPTSGQSLADGAVAFSWSPSTDADGDPVTYRLELTRAQGLPRLLSAAGPSLLLPAGDALTPGDYTFRVEALDGKSSSGFSAPRSFSVQPAVVTPGPEAGGSGGCGSSPASTGAAPWALLLFVAAYWKRRRSQGRARSAGA